MKTQLDLNQLPALCIGIDEVGRGCLAGPVVAAAVLLRSDIDIDQYIDSKKISEIQRSVISKSIHLNHSVGIGWASVEEIDEINILQASFLAMKRAVDILKSQCQLAKKTKILLIDGRDQIPNLENYIQHPIIKGDQKVRAISAASIAAKVARDQFMIDLAKTGNEYGFEKHKGYGTKFHQQQIKVFGPSKWHRKTFAGVKEYFI